MRLDEQLEAIQTMTMTQKIIEWQRLFKCPPPPAFGAGLLGRAIACRLQEKVYGGLTKSELRLLAKHGGDAKPAHGAPAATHLELGTTLSRTWHGERHVVVVLAEGFLYRAQVYSSLSLIARVITGTPWSGPRFFGLKGARGAQPRACK